MKKQSEQVRIRSPHPRLVAGRIHDVADNSALCRGSQERWRENRFCGSGDGGGDCVAALLVMSLVGELVLFGAIIYVVVGR